MALVCAAVVALLGVAVLGYRSAMTRLESKVVSLGRATIDRASASPDVDGSKRLYRLASRGQRPLHDTEPDAWLPAESESNGPPAPAARQRAIVRKASTIRHTKERGHKSRTPAQSTFRTVCVRLCDGAYVPMSFATTAEHLDDDADRCASRCDAPARLYVGPGQGSGTLADMTDLAGHRYGALETAFRFRSGITQGCSCRPEAWQDAALDRHRGYALESQARHGDEAARQALALRRAVDDVRAAGPADDRVALSRSHKVPPLSRPDALVFGPPVVAPLDDADTRPVPAPRYAGSLKPLSVVLDATGSPARRPTSSKPARAVTMTMIAVVHEPANQIATGSLPSASEPAQSSPALTGPASPRPARAALAMAEAAESEDRAGSKPLKGNRFSRGKAAQPSADEARAELSPKAVEPVEPRKRRAATKTAPAQIAAQTGVVAATSPRGQQARAQIGRKRAERAQLAVANATIPVDNSRRIARATVEADWKELLFRPY